MNRPPARPRSPVSRVPVAAWVVVAVIVVHAVFFWAIADKHYLPKTRYIPPAPPANFATREQTSIDTRTGETIREQEFVVSTHLTTPPSPRPSATPDR